MARVPNSTNQYAHGRITYQQIGTDNAQRPWVDKCMWEIKCKPNKDVKVFEAQITQYEDRAETFMDHLCRTNRGWRDVIIHLQAQ